MVQYSVSDWDASQLKDVSCVELWPLIHIRNIKHQLVDKVLSLKHLAFLSSHATLFTHRLIRNISVWYRLPTCCLCLYMLFSNWSRFNDLWPFWLSSFLLQIRLPPEVNRILYVRNLPYKITAEEMYDIFGKYGPIRQIRTLVLMNTRRWSTPSCLKQWLHIVHLGCKVADHVVVFCFGPSEETPLRREEPPTWSMKTFLTPRMHATTCQASTSATATWWSSTTTQTEYVEALSCRGTLHYYKRWLLYLNHCCMYSSVIKMLSFLS